MDVLKNIWKICSVTFEKIYIRLRYNEYTIVKYLRKKGATIGENCLFHSWVLGDDLYLVNIGNHVFVSVGVILHTHDGAAWIVREDFPGTRLMGRIIIEDNCILGARSQILPNVRIGRNSIIGAGSVVISDVPPNSVGMGVPARVIGSSIKYREKCVSIWKEQKPADYDKMNEVEKEKALKQHLLNNVFKYASNS
jgi:acetyltransferase-like isoleucine patch superfamily enzyme